MSKQISAITAGSGLDGTEKVHALQGANSRAITTAQIAELAISAGLVGARTSLTTTTVIAATTNTIVSWDAAAWEANGTFWAGGNPTRLTIPTSPTITHVQVTAHAIAQAAEGAGAEDFIIRIKLNGAIIHKVIIDNQFWGPPMISSGLIAVVAGDYLELELWSTIAWDLDEALTFMSIECFNENAAVTTGTEFKGFRATTAATQGVTGATETAVTFGTEEFDTEGALASNVFTVPAVLDTEYVNFSAGVEFSTDENWVLEIQRSTDGGSSWLAVVKMSGTQAQASVSSGPTLVATDEQYRVAVTTDDASTIQDLGNSFFSGEVSQRARAANVVENTIRVGKSGADFETVQEAIDKINSLGTVSASNRHQILVHPGKYITTATLTLPAWCTLKGASKGAVQFQNDTTDLFTCSGNNFFEDFLIEGGTLSTTYAFECNNTSGIHIRNVDMLNNGGTSTQKFLNQSGATWSVLFIERCVIDYYFTSGYAISLTNSGAAARFCDVIINDLFLDSYQLTGFGGGIRVQGCQDVRVKRSTIRGAATWNTGIRLNLNGVTGTPRVKVFNSDLEGGIALFNEAGTEFILGAVVTDGSESFSGTKTIRSVVV